MLFQEPRGTNRDYTCYSLRFWKSRCSGSFHCLVRTATILSFCKHGHNRFQFLSCSLETVTPDAGQSYSSCRCFSCLKLSSAHVLFKIIILSDSLIQNRWLRRRMLISVQWLQLSNDKMTKSIKKSLRIIRKILSSRGVNNMAQVPFRCLDMRRRFPVVANQWSFLD